jgi:RHH-type proline utilization regulon transcriptional repressor/proline dehydrogenase/delta 1-pyrroline-5-carboxylate dehydrogenase
VGLEIQRRAHADLDQLQIKRIVAELGGKNCVLIDSDVDLDEAVPAIVDSAFGYAGQKCSAAALVLVHEAIADALIERLRGAVEILVVGQADALDTQVPPVIEQAARDRVARYVHRAGADGQVVAQVQDYECVIDRQLDQAFRKNQLAPRVKT